MSQEKLTIPTEFVLPERVHNLVRRIQNEFVGPLRTALEAATRNRDDELKASQAARATAETDFKKYAADQNEKAERIAAASARELEQVRSLSLKAATFLKVHGLELAPAMRSTAFLSGITCDSLRDRVNTLTARKRLKLWPEREELRWVVGFSSIVLAFFFFPLLLTWPVVVLIARLVWDADVRNQYSTIQGEADELAELLNAKTEEARSIAQAAIEREEKSKYEPALARASKMDEAARQQYEARCRQLEESALQPAASFRSEIDAIWADSSFAAMDWAAADWQRWRPDDSPTFAARIGTLTVDVSDIRPILRQKDLGLTVPALIPFNSGRCLLLEAPGKEQNDLADVLRSALLRVLATTPPGKARFVFIDPVGLGRNVADFMALGDVDGELIAGRAWSEGQHINDQLRVLTEHMETVIQKYLRNEYDSILHYNEMAEEVAEPYRFLVVFNFPVNFTDESARRMMSIVHNGPRCGVFTLLVHDSTKPLPYGFSIEELHRASNRIVWNPSVEPTWQDEVHGRGVSLSLDSGPSPERARNIVSTVGRLAAASMKVEFPFEKLLAAAGVTADLWWRGSSQAHMRIPIGLLGARRIQFMSFGDGLAHHGLIVGRTGSGKTNLMHIMILMLALSYSPEELQLYLVDFKGGVGFKPYASVGLPHAAVIAIESDREFGISVLNGLDDMLKERFELFRSAGVDNITDYRECKPTEHLPRILLIVDEYQEFFGTEDAIAQNARMIIDRISRQGRSFGIHILLGTQSLSGIAHLPTSTMGQMAIRIALPCNESDARTIFAEDNSAARFLTRPGEAIYNSAAGAVESNSPFQIALIDDASIQHYLRKIIDMADGQVYKKPLVFEGNEPADIEQSDPLREMLKPKKWEARPTGQAWLGEPVAIMPTIHCTFSRKPGRHLLIIDRDEAQGLGVLHAAWLSLLCQHRPTEARFYVLDLSTADQEWAERSNKYRELFDHQIELISRRSLPSAFSDILDAVHRFDAASDKGPAPIYLLIQGLQRAKDLRWSPEQYYSKSVDSENLPAQFATILRDGPEANIHVLAWCDTVANARRSLDRHLLEFGVRVTGPLSIDDSHALLDVPDASRINRLHRLLFFDEEKPGVIRKFRPFKFPSLEWLRGLSLQQKQWES